MIYGGEFFCIATRTFTFLSLVLFSVSAAALTAFICYRDYSKALLDNYREARADVLYRVSEKTDYLEEEVIRLWKEPGITVVSITHNTEEAVHLPGNRHAGERIQALPQNIDVMPTLMEFYGISSQVCRNPIHGKSLLPLIEGETGKVRDCALYGYFGKQMNITDGRYTYFRSPNRENRPLNLYTTMMTDIRVYFDYSGIPGDNCRISAPEKITGGQFLKWTPYPVFKVPADAITDFEDGTLRYVRLFDWEMEDQLYDLETDYEQEHNIIDSQPEVLRRMEEMMKGALKEHDAPKEQFVRLRFQEM